MKLLLSCAAAAVAMAPPKISLDLEGMAKLANPIYRSHNEKLTQPDGTAVKSRQDWTASCAAGRPAAECPMPVAKGHDANDKLIAVRTRIFQVDVDGSALLKEVKAVDFTKRSTYLFKYDATDAAMNHAEQVVFALVLDDKTAPKISLCNGAKQTVEAGAAWTLCKSFANDNIDGVLSDSMKYTITMIPSKDNNVWSKKVLPKVGATLVKDVSYAEAKTAIDSDVVGDYVLTASVTDKAGVYGANSASNSATSTQAILVADTTKPVIAIHGAQPAVAECGMEYSDEGAYASDTLDTAKLGRKVEVTSASTVDTKKVGWYAVTYDAKDTAQNAATTATRRVAIKDTTVPRIYLKGSPAMEIYAGEHKEGFAAEPGVTTFDQCDKSKMKVTMAWIGANGEFDDRVPGMYVRQYCVEDHMGLKNCVTRKVNVSDKSKPMIIRQGPAVETFEASHDITYTDKGAKCTDYVDGDISHAVEVSGQVVNMARPSTYKITYNCADNQGNVADPETRTVVIQDTTCPVVTITGAATAYVEAGFPYKDAGATATDSLDGDITSTVWTDGNSVDTAMSFMDLRSCKEIQAQYPAANTAEYYITAFNSATKKYQRITVWCDMHTHKQTAYTYHAIKKGMRVVPYQDGVRAASPHVNTDFKNSCGALGLRMAHFYPGSPAKASAIAKFGKAYFPADGATSDQYLCSTNDAWNAANTKTVAAARKVMAAEVGKYVISYHVSDKAGNKECTTHTRTVVVKDTLAPVISLHFHDKTVLKAPSKAEFGLGNTRNPAQLAATNPNFMAESTTVNGWMIAAVASAVAGVALVGLSTKSHTVVDV